MATSNKIIYILLAFNFVFSGKGDNVCLIPTEKSNDAEWEQKHEELVKLAEGNTSNDIVWIGASIIERMQGSTLWDTKIEPLGAINLGISGDRVENVLWRMESDEFKFKINIDIVVIYVGSNNIYDDSPEDIAEGIINLVNVAKERLGNELIVVLPTHLPRGEDPNDVARPRLTKVNDLLKEAYPGNPTNNVYVVEIGQNAIGPDGMLSTDDFVDFLHPTDSGYTKFFTPVYDLLVKVLSHH